MLLRLNQPFRYPREGRLTNAMHRLTKSFARAAKRIRICGRVYIFPGRVSLSLRRGRAMCKSSREINLRFVLGKRGGRGMKHDLDTNVTLELFAKFCCTSIC